MLCQRALLSEFPLSSLKFVNVVVSRFVLEQILSGEATEDVVGHIHEYLGTISANVREETMKLEEFIVFKVSILRLTFTTASLHFFAAAG